MSDDGVSAGPPFGWPRFIKDEAVDQDSFGSHERIARAMAGVIANAHDFRIIGLLGPWGSGKSTVAKITEKILSPDISKTKTHFFYYDTWLHQSDPPRRAFLESLIRFLIKRNLTTEEKWRDRLDELNRRIEENETITTPTFTSAGRWFVASLFGVPIGLEFIGHDWFDSAYDTNWINRVFHIEGPSFAKFLFPAGVLLTLLPAIVAITIYLSWRPKISPLKAKFWTTHRDEHRNDSLLSIFANKEINRNRSKITRSPDPTAIEFQETFKQILAEIEGGQNLVFVIDNLDRLPEADGVAMWSTIRSFFLGSASAGARLPTIILPIDERAVRRMYVSVRSDGQAADDLAKSFMDKTFDIVFRVPRPVLSDWSGYFDQQIKYAFGENINEKDEFNAKSILRQTIATSPNIEITPRYINSIVNTISTYWAQWWSQIPFPTITYFSVRRSDIESELMYELNTPRAGIQEIDPDWQKSVAAMHFGVARLDDAIQIVMEQPLASAIEMQSVEEFKKLSKIKGFDWVFEQALLANFSETTNSTEPRFALNAAHLLRGASGLSPIWLDKQWDLLRRTFMVAGAWKSLQESDVSALQSLGGSVLTTGARDFSASVARKLSAVDAVQLSTDAGLKTFVSLYTELGNFSTSHGLTLPRVNCPGDANTYLRAGLVLGVKSSYLAGLLPGVSVTDVAADIINRFADQNRVGSVVDVLGVALASAAKIPLEGIWAAAGQAITDKPIGDPSVGVGLEVLGLLRSVEGGSRQLIADLAQSGQLNSKLQEAVGAKLPEVQAAILALLLLSNAASDPPNGDWASFLRENPGVPQQVDECVGRYGGKFTLHILVAAAKAHSQILPLVRAVFDQRVEATNLGSLDIVNILGNLGDYKKACSENVFPSFVWEMSRYQAFWEKMSSQALNVEVISILLGGSDAEREGATKDLKARSERLGEGEWIESIKTTGPVYSLTKLLFSAVPSAFPIATALPGAMSKMIMGLSSASELAWMPRWFEASHWLSSSERSVLYRNVRDLVNGGSLGEKVVPVLLAGGSELIEQGNFGDEPDDAARHAVSVAIADPIALNWLTENSIAIQDWLSRAEADTRPFIAGRLKEAVRVSDENRAHDLGKLAEQWGLDIRSSEETSVASDGVDEPDVT